MIKRIGSRLSFRVSFIILLRIARSDETGCSGFRQLRYVIAIDETLIAASPDSNLS